jgi:hypothetical protein
LRLTEKVDLALNPPLFFLLLLKTGPTVGKKKQKWGREDLQKQHNKKKFQYFHL